MEIESHLSSEGSAYLRLAACRTERSSQRILAFVFVFLVFFLGRHSLGEVGCGYSPFVFMNIVVLGLWHLGCVTAACAAKFESVIGLDFDSAVVAQLQNGRPPLFEPGLADLIDEGLQNKRLAFSDDPAVACRDADLLWVCYDTPVDDNDVADLTPVIDGIRRCVPHLRSETLILISSQIPAGTCRALEARFPSQRFAYSPENLRLGKALSIFSNADRIILGARTEADAKELEPLLAHFTQNLIVVRPESAEMIKHAINSFLASSIAFMNEISRVCEQVGADAKEVERGLKSEPRIGPGAYLSPGGPFAGGTLARDVVALTKIGQEQGEPLVLVPAIKLSNDRHKLWAIQKLREELGELSGKRVAILGLTYKPGTDTLRRSLALNYAESFSKPAPTCGHMIPSSLRFPMIWQASCSPENWRRSSQIPMR